MTARFGMSCGTATTATSRYRKQAAQYDLVRAAYEVPRV